MIKMIMYRASKSVPLILLYVCAALFSALYFLVSTGALNGAVPFAGFSRLFTALQYTCIFLIPFTAAVINDKTTRTIIDMMPFSCFSAALSQRAAASAAATVFFASTAIIPVSVSFFRQIDASAVILSYLMLLLFAAASFSVSFFINELIPHKTASFLITVLLLTGSALDEVMRHPVLSYFSLNHYISSAMLGIANLRDVLFYFANFFLFLVFDTGCRYYRKKGSFSRSQKSFLAVSAVFSVLLCITSQMMHVKLDVTPEKIFSVSPYSRQVLESLSSKLRITYYRSDRIKTIYPQSSGIEDYLYEYAAAGKRRVSIEIINPDKDEEIKKSIENAGITGQQLESSKAGAVEYITIYSGILIEYENYSFVVPFIVSPAGLEYDLTRSVSAFSGSFDSRAVIITGNSENPEKDFPYLAPWLERSGFTPVVYTASQWNEGASVSAGVPIIICGSTLINAQGAERIEHHISSGSPALFTVSPVSIDTDSSWSTQVKQDHVIKMLSTFGLSLRTEIVMDESCWKMPLTADTQSSQRRFVDYYAWPSVSDEKTLSNIQLYWPSSFDIYQSANAVITPILITSENSFSQKAGTDSGIPFITDPFLISDVYEAVKNTDKPRSYITAVKLEGSLPGYFLPETKQNTRIAAASDQYMLSKMISYTGNPAGLDFAVNSLLWLTSNEALLDIRSRSMRYTGKSSYIKSAPGRGSVN